MDHEPSEINIYTCTIFWRYQLCQQMRCITHALIYSKFVLDSEKWVNKIKSLCLYIEPHFIPWSVVNHHLFTIMIVITESLECGTWQSILLMRQWFVDIEPFQLAYVWPLLFISLCIEGSIEARKCKSGVGIEFAFSNWLWRRKNDLIIAQITTCIPKF